MAFAMTLAAAFFEHVHSNPNALALVGLTTDGSQKFSITRGDLALLVQRTVGAFVTAGLRPGNKVAITLGKTPELAAIHLACSAMGLIAVPLNAALSETELKDVLARADVQLAVTTPEFLYKHATQRSAISSEWWIVDEASSIPGTRRWSEVLNSAKPTSTLPAVLLEKPALLIFTSGTTGQPKGVALTHQNILANLRALIQECWHISEHDRLLHVLPTHHVHGLVLALYGSLYAGCAIVTFDKFDAAQTYKALRDNKITVFMGVPTMYHRLVDLPDAAPIATMRLFTCGSAPLSPETFKQFEQRFGARIVERYGLTETLINTSNPVHGEQKIGSVGKPLYGVAVTLLDPQSQQVVEDQKTGEICVRGDNVFSGYWNDPEITRKAFHNQWFRTGDLGRFDADGYLYISGRLKELIIVGGSNVTPGEVERALEDTPGLAECAVAGAPDPDMGEKIVAFIVARKPHDNSALEIELRKRADERLAPYKRPKVYVFVETLPRNAMGKIERQKLGAALRSK